jgi:crotonobetainyl-CoA:carnitine CoA-transferase CaiB-like acyl-CoA transferase
VVNTELPLSGIRVLDYSQYVAGPFATMLMADLGAEVIKVEPPTGDGWRHYQPLTPDGGRWFIALNRNKKSVVADLKTNAGREFSDALLRTADVVVHNMPVERARAFGLDRESLRAINPSAVCCHVSAFGTAGPQSGGLGYDLIAQAASGLLLADAREGDDVPRRSGGIAMADLTAGLLTLASALAGLTDRFRAPDSRTGRGFEVSLLGAALAVQVQRFVDIGPAPATPDDMCSPERLAEIARETSRVDELEPYYRCYRAADGFLAIACLNTPQRRRAGEILGIDDPWADNPQAPPRDAAERVVRAHLKDRFAAQIRTQTVQYWIDTLTVQNVPCGPVREIGDVHRLEQAESNGLVQRIEQPGIGEISLLGAIFKIDGRASSSGAPAPLLGEHTDQLQARLRESSAELSKS